MKLDPIENLYEGEEDYAQKLNDYQDELRETLVQAARIPDGVFPEFLFTPQVNDFGDNYFKRALSASQSTVKIGMLRKKYSDYFDYLDALDLYEEYMESLIEKYGSLSILMSGHELGVIDDAVPDPPKLKSKKINRMLSRSGVYPSRMKGRTLSIEQLKDVIDERYTEDGSGVTADPTDDKPPKDIRKVFKASAREQAREYRKNNIYSAYQGSESMDAIIDFMNAKNRSYYNESGQAQSDDSISAVLEEKEKYMYIHPDVVERMMRPNAPIIMNGRMVDAAESEKIAIYTELYEQGFDLLNTASKTMSKSANVMLRRQLSRNGQEPLSDKEFKKMKKKQKKEERRFAKSLGDDFVHSVLKTNKIGMGDQIDYSRFTIDQMLNGAGIPDDD